MSYSPFVSLHNHTELGSPLDGMNDVDALFDQAKELDNRAIAITDHGTLTAHYDCWKASKRTGVKLIPGIEAYFSNDLSIKKTNHLVLLAKNEVGYKNILRLNYESYKSQVSGYMGKKTPRVGWENLRDFNEGVICLTACSNGILAKSLIYENDEDEAVKRMLMLKEIFNDRLFLEIQPHSLKTEDGKVDQIRLNEILVKFSNDYNVNYVATCDAHYIDRDHAKYHDLMLAIKDKKAVDDPNRFRYGVQDMYLKSHEELISFFGKNVAEKAMKNSILISDSCEVPSYLEPKGPRLPKYPVKEESDYVQFNNWRKFSGLSLPEDKAYLRFKCIKGFKEKFKDLEKKDFEKHWSRVKTELSVLEEKDFSSYMLIVSDYISWAKNKGIPVGPARGSAAGSLVAYLTNITSVNPIEYDLIFERFHNKEKKSFPDIDTDFANPGAVKKYLREKYGEDRVASISNWSTLSPKVIIKDVARSIRLGGDKSSAFKIANNITSIMPDTKTIEEAMEQSSEFCNYMKKYPNLYENAIKLQGLTRNWSVHAAGVVIGDRPLYESVPLRIDGSTGLVVTQWEKNRCEENGLIKMDLLGLKTLTVMDEAFKLIKQSVDKDIGIDDIPLDDKETYEMISKGKTTGVFQLESSLTPLCMKIKPDNIGVVSDINALGRPSCSASQRKAYVKRRFKIEDVDYRHSTLENALKNTYGVSLYEEGMMKIAKDCAGWDLNQADALRKITKLKGKDKDLVLRTEASFIKDCIEHSNMKYSEAKDIWDHEILPFGAYGFNKSHSISYSHISVQTAWLRRHYPVQFMCALLNSEDPNSDKAQEYLNECANMGIKVLAPDINHSGGTYCIRSDKEITTGLSAIKGLGDAAIKEIIQNQPYSNISDFLVKNNGRTVGKTAIQSLAKSGAFENFSRTRKDIFDNYQKYRTKLRSAVSKGRDLEGVELPDSDEEWDRKHILLYEKEVLGRTISGSLHEVFSGFFTGGYNITMLDDVNKEQVGNKIKIEAIVNSKIKEFKIKKGKNIGRKFAKYLIEDVDGGTCDLTLWADQYDRFRPYLIDGIPIKAICRINEYMGQKSLSLVEIEKIYGR